MPNVQQPEMRRSGETRLVQDSDGPDGATGKSPRAEHHTVPADQQSPAGSSSSMCASHRGNPTPKATATATATAREGTGHNWVRQPSAAAPHHCRTTGLTVLLPELSGRSSSCPPVFELPAPAS